MEFSPHDLPTATGRLSSRVSFSARGSTLIFLQDSQFTVNIDMRLR